MEAVTELRVALTVADFEKAVAFYGEALGLEQLADWSDDHDGSGRTLHQARQMNSWSPIGPTPQTNSSGRRET